VESDEILGLEIAEKTVESVDVQVGFVPAASGISVPFTSSSTSPPSDQHKRKINEVDISSESEPVTPMDVDGEENGRRNLKRVVNPDGTVEYVDTVRPK